MKRIASAFAAGFMSGLNAIGRFEYRIIAALAANPNATVFLVGLTVLCASVSRWSRPLAGTILGAVLMLVAVWPFMTTKRGD